MSVLLDLSDQPRDVAGTDPEFGPGGENSLQRRPEFGKLFLFQPVPVDIGDERSQAGAGDDEAFVFQVQISPFDGDRADLERIGQLAYGRQLVAGFEVARGDGVLDLIRDLFVHRVRMAGRQDDEQACLLLSIYNIHSILFNVK